MAGRNVHRLAGLLPPAAMSGTTPRAWFEPATVTDVAAGAASDGNALVTVSWRGGIYLVPYDAGYAPTIGDTVRLMVQPPQVVIVGRTIGAP